MDTGAINSYTIYIAYITLQNDLFFIMMFLKVNVHQEIPDT